MSYFNKYKLAFLVLVIFLFPFFAQAMACSPIGYSVFTINGINTDENGARENKRALEDHLPPTYNNQKITTDFLHNKSHGKIVDALEVTNQIYFDQNSFNIQDADFAQMLTDASAKLTTQKVLLVSHSQGNFYANTFYDAVVDEDGGVPSISISVYGVASPASRVAGGGLYLTSDTDKMIIGTVAKFPFTNILKPNTHINFNVADDTLGHSFSKTYLNYEGERIVADIKTSLNKLQNNNIQKENALCINPPKLTWTQKIQGTMLAVVDPVSIPLQAGIVYVSVSSYQIAMYIGNGVWSGINTLAYGIYSLAQSLFNNTKTLAANNPASVIIATNDTNSAMAESVSQNNVPAPKKENITPTAEARLPQLPQKTNSIPESTVGATSQPNEIITPAPALVENVPVPVSSLQNVNENSTENVSENPPIIVSTVIRRHHHSTPDTTAPVVSIIGDSSVEIVKNSTYTDAGATASDNIDGDLTSAIVKSGTFVDTSVVGTFTIIYTVTDAAGNSSSLTRTINVVAPPDTTAPVITILGDNPKTILLGSTYSDVGATALDAVDGTISVVTTGTVDTGVVGNYTLTYTATDVARNVATATRTVNVAANFATSYFENSQYSLVDSDSLSTGRFYFCSNVTGIAPILTFGSIFPVSAGGVYLDSIGVRGVAGSGTVSSASLKIYSYTGAGGYHAALQFRSGTPLGSLITTSDIFNPSTWSSADDSTNPLDFPYKNIAFSHTFLPEGNYFMTFGDCTVGTGDYFGVKGSGRSFSPDGMQTLFNYYSSSIGSIIWDHLGGFSFDYIINGSF